MKTSNVKKVLSSVLIFMIAFIILSSIVIAPYVCLEAKYIQDKNTRSALSGTIDCIVVDASQGATGFDPRVLDKNMGCNSYNLSNSMMTMYGRYELLKKEIGRNPIDTVILGLSYEALTREESEDYGDGDSTTIVRFDTLGEQVSFLVRRVKLKNWTNIYARCFVEGIDLWTKLATGKYKSRVVPEEKGLWEKTTSDIYLTREQVHEIKDSMELNTVIQQDNVRELEDIVNLCKQNDIRVICVSVPVSDGTLIGYTTDSLNEYYGMATDICNRLDVEFYDFNLLKDRTEILSDKTTFYDDEHLSTDGAQIFSKKFCDVIKAIDGGADKQAIFFDDYAELKSGLYLD